MTLPRKANHISTSRARRRLPMKRSWSCSTNCDRASGREFLSGNRRAAGKPFPPSAVQSSEIEPDERSQDTRRGTDQQGGGAGQAGRRDEIRASRLERGECDVRIEDGAVVFLKCRCESNQRQSRNGWDQRSSRKTIYRRNGVVSRPVVGRAATATSERMDVTGGESAALNLVDTAVTRNARPGVKVLGKTTYRELLAPRLRRESGGVTPTAQMTQATEGRRAEVQGCAAVVGKVERLPLNSKSGRARDRAMCPAVARSNEGRGA